MIEMNEPILLTPQQLRRCRPPPVDPRMQDAIRALLTIVEAEESVRQFEGEPPRTTGSLPPQAVLKGNDHV
jgi:hypothetical protein